MHVLRSAAEPVDDYPHSLLVFLVHLNQHNRQLILDRSLHFQRLYLRACNDRCRQTLRWPEDDCARQARAGDASAHDTTQTKRANHSCNQVPTP